MGIYRVSQRVSLPKTCTSHISKIGAVSPCPLLFGWKNHTYLVVFSQSFSMTVGNTPELMSVKHGSVEFGSMFDEFDTRILYPRRRIVSRAAVFPVNDTTLDYFSWNKKDIICRKLN